MRTPFLLSCSLLLASTFAACGGGNGNTGGSGGAGGTPLVNETITPEPFVPPPLPGFSFPVDEATISSWTNNFGGNGESSIALHAWGLWAGLTTFTQQTWNSQFLRVYETWDTPDLLACSSTPDKCPKTPRPLKSPEQLPNQTSNLAVTVNYDPTSSKYVLDNSLIDPNVLTSLQGQGTMIGRITLPNTSIALKPTYKVFSRSAGQYAMLKIWSGPPNVPSVWGEGLWPTCVWIDLDDDTDSYGPFAPTTSCGGDGPTSPANVVPRGAFISFVLDAEEAARAQAAGFAQAAQGDIAILVAMHVTSRESTEQITRWTWQTFWWSPDADASPEPSTPAMIAARPAEALKARTLQGANYAGCAAYQMLYPDQPKTGGDPSGGAPVYCYNPYLEAPFGTTALPLTSGTPGWTYNGTTYAPQFGVQSNCMSCHLNAAWGNGKSFPKTGTSLPLPNCNGGGCYGATEYIDMDAAYFQGSVTTDGLWSIPCTAGGCP